MTARCRRSLGAGALLALISVAGVPSLRAQKPPSFPAGVALVKVDVVVVDKDGKPVLGLTREDFRVFDEGRERRVQSFEAVAAPPPAAEDEIRVRPQRVSTNAGQAAAPSGPLFLLVFDCDRLSRSGMNRALKAPGDLVAASAGLDADVTLASTCRDATWAGTIRDLRAPTVLDRALDTVVGRLGAGVLNEDLRRGRFVDLIERFAAGRGGRTTMIVLAEGGVAPRRTRDDISAAAAQHRVVIHGLDARGLEAPGLGVDQARLPGTAETTASGFVVDGRDSWVAELALATGGRNLRGTANLDVALARIVEESLSYYLLGFEPDSKAEPGELRAIRVQLVGKTHEVRARQAYAVPRSGGRSLLAPAEGPPLALRATAYVRGPVAEGRSSVRLALEVDPATLDVPTGGGRVTLESRVDFVPLGGGQAQRAEHRSDIRLTPELRETLAEAWVPFARDVDLAPGRYEARVTLRDADTGRAGSLVHAFDVPETGSLRITTPVITDLFRPDGSPREIARVRFDPSREVECAFEVLDFATAQDGRPRLAARWALRSAANEEVAAGDAAPRGESPSQFLFPLPLPRLADGSYTLRLAVRDLVRGYDAEAEVPVEIVHQ